MFFSIVFLLCLVLGFYSFDFFFNFCYQLYNHFLIFNFIYCVFSFCTRFSREPLTSLWNILPCNIFSWTDLLALISLTIYGHIHSVCSFFGSPFTLLLYKNARYPTDKFLFLIFRSCQSLCCCFWISWRCIAIIRCSSSFDNCVTHYFLSSSTSMCNMSTIIGVCYQKCKGMIASYP